LHKNYEIASSILLWEGILEDDFLLKTPILSLLISSQFSPQKDYQFFDHIFDTIYSLQTKNNTEIFAKENNILLAKGIIFTPESTLIGIDRTYFERMVAEISFKEFN
jgi:hypothetical protein